MRVHARAIGVVWVIAFAAVALMAWPGRAFATANAPTQPSSASVSASSGVNAANVINYASKGSVSVAVGFSEAPYEGSVTVTLTDSASTLVTGSVSVAANNTQTSFVVSGIDTATLVDGVITVSASHTHVTAGTSTVYAGTSATRDTSRPTVSIIAPTASAYTNSTAPTLSASVTDTEGVATVQFEITGAGDSTFANTGSALTSATTGSTYSYTMPSGTLSTDGVYQVRAVATDTAANSTTSSVVSFTVDTTRPAVALEYAIASSVPASTSAASTLTYNPSLSRP
ncbi:MAG: hypothetical protein KGS10_13510, partial [Chloroflexi bacterium]|nr:hypothetical protein [Chloroflexota bacterium]